MRRKRLFGAVLVSAMSGALALGSTIPVANADPSDGVEQEASDHVEPEARGGGTTAAKARNAANDYLAEHRGAFKLSPQQSLKQVANQAGAEGTRYVSYERSYKGLPVFGGDFVLAVDAAGKVVGNTRASDRAVKLDSVSPRIGKAAARKAARSQVDTVRSVSEPTLAVYAHGKSRLAWTMQVDGIKDGKPSSVTLYLDARTGKTLLASDLVSAGSGNGYYYGNVTIPTSGSGSSYSMKSSGGVQCGGQNGSAYTGSDDNWGNGGAKDLETACVDVLYGTDQEVKMLKSWLGRDGVMGNGSTYPARVGLNDVNAYWNGQFVNFGHSADNARNLTAIDIVAHEQGHGIFYTTPGGSTGGNETGGLNEATGDIFGALTEAYANNPNDPADFLVGEEANLTGDGPIRNMYNPGALGDPNCYSASIPNTEVHAAAGPLNHWFYLLAKGSNSSPASPTCNNSTVSGVGIQTAGKIFYNGLLLKTSSWTHGKARVATLTAAKNLYGTDCTNFNAVKKAWDAVSVPAQSGEPTCGGGTDPTDPPPSTGDCTKTTATGSVSTGTSSWKPSTSGFSTGGGTITACLTGPSSADFDLYLQKKSSSGSWQDVAASEGSTSTEKISYAASSGSYRIEVYAYSGSGSYTLKYNTP